MKFLINVPTARENEFLADSIDKCDVVRSIVTKFSMLDSGHPAWRAPRSLYCVVTDSSDTMLYYRLKYEVDPPSQNDNEQYKPYLQDDNTDKLSD